TPESPSVAPVPSVPLPPSPPFGSPGCMPSEPFSPFMPSTPGTPGLPVGLGACAWTPPVQKPRERISTAASATRRKCFIDKAVAKFRGLSEMALAVNTDGRGETLQGRTDKMSGYLYREVRHGTHQSWPK